jgi:hypothetical protein
MTFEYRTKNKLRVGGAHPTVAYAVEANVP